MKRVVCLLLSLILLLGLLPTALADGNGPNWVVLCNEDGTEREMRRTQELYNCMYGESVYFHLYADETGGTPVEGLTQTFYVDGETVHDPSKPDYKVKVSWDAEKKYYVWDTNGFSNNKVQISLGDGTNNYSFFANLTIEDIGWFWSRSPSVASALPGGGRSRQSMTAARTSACISWRRIRLPVRSFRMILRRRRASRSGS